MKQRYASFFPHPPLSFFLTPPLLISPGPLCAGDSGVFLNPRHHLTQIRVWTHGPKLPKHKLQAPAAGEKAALYWGENQ